MTAFTYFISFYCSPLLSSPGRFMPLNRWMFSGLILSGRWAAFCGVLSFFLAAADRQPREVCLSWSVSGAEVWKVRGTAFSLATFCSSPPPPPPPVLQMSVICAVL